MINPVTKQRQRVHLGRRADLRPGAVSIVAVDGIEIGVFDLGDRIVAYRNHCPHQGAPVCRGRIGGTTLPSAPGEYVFGRHGRVLHCPWHGGQFDLESGEALFGQAGQRVRLAPVEVAVEGDVVVAYMTKRG